MGDKEEGEYCEECLEYDSISISLYSLNLPNILTRMGRGILEGKPSQGVGRLSN